MNLLAQIDFAGAPAGIAVWLGCFAFVLMLVNGGFKLAGNIKGRPPQEISQPLTVQAAREYATKQELSELRQEFTGQMLEMNRDIKLLRDEVRHDRDLILTAGEQRAVRINERIDEMPERLLKLLDRRA